jgi:hypothetical protein
LSDASLKLLNLAESIRKMDKEAAYQEIMEIVNDVSDLEFELRSFHNGMNGACPSCAPVSTANKNLASMLDEEQDRYFILSDKCDDLRKEICELLASNPDRQSTPGEEARSRGWHHIYDLRIKDPG